MPGGLETNHRAFFLPCGEQSEIRIGADSSPKYPPPCPNRMGSLQLWANGAPGVRLSVFQRKKTNQLSRASEIRSRATACPRWIFDPSQAVAMPLLECVGMAQESGAVLQKQPDQVQRAVNHQRNQ